MVVTFDYMRQELTCDDKRIGGRIINLALSVHGQEALREVGSEKIV